MSDPSDRNADDRAVVSVPQDSPPPAEADDETDATDDDLEAEAAAPDLTLSGPPGGSLFSLEGRPAAGLYFVAWFFALAGFGVLFLTFLAASEGIAVANGVAGLLGVVGTSLLGLGLATAAGYQIVARGATRPPEAYRGPSPPIAFGVSLLLAFVASLALIAMGLKPVDDPLGFLANLIAVELAYVVAVWLLAVRSKALTWWEMGWPIRRPAREVARDLLYGAGLIVPTLFGISLLAVIVSKLLGGVSAPDIVPASHTGTDVLLLALATIVVAPVGEELFFRGFALTAWWRDLGLRSALIRSALFFALIHIVNVQSVDFGTGVKQVILILVQIIPLGFVLGWLFARRGIVASIAGHATYNAVIFLVALSVSGIPNV